MEQEKKYLRTIEELKNALDSGNTVYGEDAGIRIRKSENGSYFYEDKTNCERFTSKFLFLPVLNKFYKLEPKPMKVKLFHLYEDGCGARILIKHKMNVSVPYPFAGVILGAYGCHYYTKEGKCWVGEKKNNLVKEIADLSKYFEKEPDNAKND